MASAVAIGIAIFRMLQGALGAVLRIVTTAPFAVTPVPGAKPVSTGQLTLTRVAVLL